MGPSGKEAVTVEYIFEIEDQIKLPKGLERVETLQRGKPFSMFIPSHREAAYALVDIFKGTLSISKLNFDSVNY